MQDMTKDILRNVKKSSDSKADFFFPTAMEKLANIFTDHMSKDSILHVKTDLAATALREGLDQDVCDAVSSDVSTKLDLMIRKSKSYSVTADLLIMRSSLLTSLLTASQTSWSKPSRRAVAARSVFTCRMLSLLIWSVKMLRAVEQHEHWESVGYRQLHMVTHLPVLQKSLAI